MIALPPFDAIGSSDGRSTEVVRWINDNAISFGLGSNALERDTSQLLSAIGEAQIVALGEPTHGTAEAAEMKLAIFQHLVRAGFTTLILEADMPGAREVDHAIALGNAIDPAINRLRFWTYRTNEFHDVMTWMQTENRRRRKGASPLRLYGMDMQFPDDAAGELERQLAAFDAGMHQECIVARALLANAGPRSDRAFIRRTLRDPIIGARRVVVRGWIKTNNLTDGWAGLTYEVRAERHGVVASDNMQRSGPRGTTAWTSYEQIIELPKEATNVTLGVTMRGEGEAFFDDLRISIEGEHGHTELAHPFDSEEELKPFSIRSRPGAYGIQVTPESHSGIGCLRMWSTGNPDTSGAAATAWKNLRQNLAEAALGDGKHTVDQKWMVQNATLVLQWLALWAPGGNRDRLMAQNIEWILSGDPTQRVAIWAHNSHVSRLTGIGAYLSDASKARYVAVAFATGSGRYLARDESYELKDLPLAAPPPNSVEAVLLLGRSAPYLIDLRPLRGSQSEPRFRTFPLFRSIGGVSASNQFYKTDVLASFDIIGFIPNSRSATPRQVDGSRL